MSTERGPPMVWGGSCRDGVGHAEVGWVIQGWIESGRDGLGWVLQGWVGPTGVQWVIQG